MITLGSGSERAATDGEETKEERDRLRGALLELEELQKTNEKDLMKRESFLDLQSLVTHMTASSPVASLLNGAASKSTPLASISSLATLQTQTNNNSQQRKEVVSPRAESPRSKSPKQAKNAKQTKEPEAAPAPANAASEAAKKKKGSTLLGKLKLPSPAMNRKTKGREGTCQAAS
jgi:hypothetical protein